MFILDKSLDIALSIFPKFYTLTHQNNYHFTFGYLKNKLVVIGQNNMLVPNAKARYFHNRFKTGQKFYQIHSEIDATSKLWTKIHIDNRLKLVNIRLSNQKSNIVMCESKPCCDCQQILAGLGVTKIWYSTKSGFNRL